MSRRYDRRQLLTAGLGLWALPLRAAAGPAADAAEAVDELGAAGWAGRALAALSGPRARFGALEDGAAGCDLGAEGRLEVAKTGPGAVRVRLVGDRGELEILRALEAPRVARVEARLEDDAPAPVGRRYDTLRRVPGGFELTFSSSLALRYAAPRRRAGELPPVYDRLAAAAVAGAARHLS